MKIETGYIYHIKDDYFDFVNDKTLMENHENGKSRPSYFTIKDGDILWFIPLSTKTEKYKKIIAKKMAKYHKCSSILIANIAGSESAILIQNAFPILPKYVSHIHTKNGVPVRIADELKCEIINCFKTLLALKHQGNNLFFSDIDKLKKIMLDEINKRP